jgi:hypothetical protein
MFSDRQIFARLSNNESTHLICKQFIPHIAGSMLSYFMKNFQKQMSLTKFRSISEIVQYITQTLDLKCDTTVSISKSDLLHEMNQLLIAYDPRLKKTWNKMKTILDGVIDQIAHFESVSRRLDSPHRSNNFPPSSDDTLNLKVETILYYQQTKEKEMNDRMCEVCNNKNNIKRCSVCSCVYYCCIEHQKIHWPVHKTQCKKLTTLLATSQHDLQQVLHGEISQNEVKIDKRTCDWEIGIETILRFNTEKEICFYVEPSDLRVMILYFIRSMEEFSSDAGDKRRFWNPFEGGLNFVPDDVASIQPIYSLKPLRRWIRLLITRIAFEQSFKYLLPLK